MLKWWAGGNLNLAFIIFIFLVGIPAGIPGEIALRFIARLYSI